MSIEESALQVYREQLTCNFQQLDLLFGDCMEEAAASLSEAGIKSYLEGASLVCMIGRGFEPVLVYLEEMPQVAARLGEPVLGLVSQSVWKISRTPNGAIILPFLQTLPEAARRLGSEQQLVRYIDMLLNMLERTSSSIHGGQATIPSPGAKEYLQQMPYLLNQLSLEGIRNWTEYGIRNYSNHPERQKDFFSLQSADSRAMLQRERHGTLFADHERQLDLYLRALWQDKDHLVPYSTAFDELRKPIPYYDSLGIRLPDVFDDTESGVPGIDRYRAVLAHIAAHRRWSHFIFADNFSPFQRIAIELLEDSRVEYLAMQQYPGLRQLWLALHPVPIEGECDPEKESCIRHRLAMLSYAILNPHHSYRNPDILDAVAQFHELMLAGETSTQAIVPLAISFIARTRIQNDQAPNVYFKNTVVEYRDDNRHLWKFIEEGDEEEQFEVERKKIEQEPLNTLPPRHYPEWDYKTQTYRPDWVSLYESLHPPGDAKLIDDLLTKHSALAKQLERILDLLKPQQYVRVRYQEEGSELDLDVAIRSLVDFKGGATPDTRINMSHRHDGRDIAVMLLLDLSQSLHQVPEGCEQSILQLSQEAVALLAWAIDRLGDSFAIAGFSSNTRHEVRYQHIKGYSESWNDQVKARLAAMEAGYSTRMGAAMRHAGHYLGNRQAEKKLLLILTDGEPSDIDVQDERLLIEDARKAVQELDRDNIYTYCINLDPRADEYVSDIFGKQYSVIDRVEKLPAKLPELFLSLTR
ncbi:nitric oxide reductase activation protein NorD [Sedimenticola selenatireducens]|uniref:nitric oxide reductase activation protein NorD n=1 Tax=Sedimenticola selenatireducens TaxID=191960 RepID=UPI00048E9B01|nr:VWA domain-containing protein [Sedimenticola selenatireducens]